MPPSYVEECKRLHTDPPYTMYLIHKMPKGDNHYYEISDSWVPGTPRGRFKLLYALRSFPRRHKNDRYTLFLVTSYGIFVEEMTHAIYDEPIDFRTIYARFVHEFYSGDIIINVPGTRQLLPLYNVRYEEMIRDTVLPNSFYYYDHPEMEVKEDQHWLILYSSNHEPVKIPFDGNLYKALRHGASYLHLRADNYIKWHNIKTWHPSF